MVCNSCFHSWRYSQRLVNTTKIVVYEVKRNRVGVIVNLLLNALVSRVKRRVCIRIVRF